MTKNTLIPDDSDQVWSWLALSMISGIGYKKIRELIEQLGSAEELLKTSAEILSEQFHIAPKLAGRVGNANNHTVFKSKRESLLKHMEFSFSALTHLDFHCDCNIYLPRLLFCTGRGIYRMQKKPLSCFCGFQRMHSLRETANTQAD